jgi:large subunit ribosomal protein L7/L12
MAEMAYRGASTPAAFRLSIAHRCDTIAALSTDIHTGAAMFVPLPLLIAIGIIFLALLAWIVRLSRPRDPLLGGQKPAYRAPLAPPSGPLAQPVTSLPPEVVAQVRAFLSAGRKIDAIKLAREVTHLGLKDAKDLVESME